jgi:hypothetical protein
MPATAKKQIDTKIINGIDVNVLDPKVKPGYEEISYTVYIKGNGTPEQFQKIHETVCATSPNRYNIANPIKLDTHLVVE